MRPLLLLLLAGLAPAAGARESIDAGAVLAASCSSCHGGQQKVLPVLSQMDTASIEQALQDFRSGARPATLMNRIAGGYTDQELALLARTLGKQ